MFFLIRALFQWSVLYSLQLKFCVETPFQVSVTVQKYLLRIESVVVSILYGIFVSFGIEVKLDHSHHSPTVFILSVSDIDRIVYGFLDFLLEFYQ